MASDYSGLNFSELNEVDILTFKILVRDGFISKMRESEAGREYLEQAWLLRQTKPDRQALRRFKDGN